MTEKQLYEKHLYMIVHPNHALVASQLNPEGFARHYTQGSTRYFEGRLIFVELDPHFRHPYFNIDHAYAELIPHEDGRPKATKFISSYRTLEHVDFSALQDLYYCNSLGELVKLSPGAYDPVTQSDEISIIMELNPIKMMVLTKFNFLEYADYITDPGMPKGAPQMLYTELEFNVDEFLSEFQENPFLRPMVPGIHPARLREAIWEVHSQPGKKVKGISLDCPVDQVSYQFLRHGFMFAAHGQTKFYPLLPLAEVEQRYFKFWRNM